MGDTRLMVPEPGLDVTPAQMGALRWLREGLIRQVTHTAEGELPPTHEFKTWTLTELGAGRIIVLLVEIGMVEDEGTWAALLCRDRRQIAIGPQGAVWLMNAVGPGGKLIHTRRHMPKGRDVLWAKVL